MKTLKDIRSGLLSEERDETQEKVEMAETQLHFIHYAAKEIIEYIQMGGEIEEWYQNKLSKVHSDVESLHSYVEGEKRRTGMAAEEVEQVDEMDKTQDPPGRDGHEPWNFDSKSRLTRKPTHTPTGPGRKGKPGGAGVTKKELVAWYKNWLKENEEVEQVDEDRVSGRKMYQHHDGSWYVEDEDENVVLRNASKSEAEHAVYTGNKKLKQKVAEGSEEKDPIWNKGTPMPKDYTCHCGLYVHPSVRNPKAIHISDCPYAKKQDKEQIDEVKQFRTAYGWAGGRNERTGGVYKMKSDERAKKDAETLLGGPVKTKPKMPPGKQPAGYRYVRGLARRAMKTGMKNNLTKMSRKLFSDMKDDVKREIDARYGGYQNEEVESVNEDRASDVQKIQSMNKGSMVGGKTELNTHLKYLNAMHTYQKKYGLDSVKTKKKIGDVSRSLVQMGVLEQVDEG
jgi:hypothetical protein